MRLSFLSRRRELRPGLRQGKVDGERERMEGRKEKKVLN